MIKQYIQTIKRRLLHPVSDIAFAAIVSVGTLLLYNIPFLSYAAQNSNETGTQWTMLMASLVVIMLAANFFATLLAVRLLRRGGRVLLALLALINALAVYFITTYSVMVDATTVENVFNTRYAEASGFFSASLWLFLLAAGGLPALWCLVQPVSYGRLRRMAAWCGGALLVILAVALMNIRQTLWISEHDTELGALLQPWSYVVNTCRVVSSMHDEQQQEILLPDGRISDEEPTAVVLVIGESARKANFQLYGYGRDTNPRLSQCQRLHVFQANACATYTTAGSKAILEPHDSGDLYELLPNYAFRTGVDVSWRTSNWGEPPIHIDEYLNNTDIANQYPGASPQYDDILLKGLRQRILQSDKKKVLVVLHTSTSHGPNYVDKYPSRFEVYKPVARNVEEGEKNVAMLVNAYDNTIRYTDYLLDSLVTTLSTIEGWRTAMLYVSDHGESLGEKGVFMHGLPMRLAPKVQYEIPFLVWTSSDFRQFKPVAAAQNAPEGQLPAVIDQHYVFHSVLNLLSIESPAYNPSCDIFLRE